MNASHSSGAIVIVALLFLILVRQGFRGVDIRIG